MNAEKLYQDFSIPYWTSGKNVAAGWINVCCPFCDDTSNHLGFNPKYSTYRCWKCGFHKTIDVLTQLLEVDKHTAQELIRKYGGRARYDIQENRVRIGLQKFKYPNNTGKMNERHMQYLEKRGFDPEFLEREWQLMGTGPSAPLRYKSDEREVIVDYKYRIVAPILWEKQIVSFQARDITNKHELRYIACPQSREIIHHKHILYGDQTKWRDTGICVEGITGVWRFGHQAFATFGIKYTTRQVHTIRKQFRRVFVVFDNEPQAQEQAEKLITELRMASVQAYGCCVIDGDSGEMKQKDADYLVRQLLKG
jgi:hypothetical protein